MAFQTSRTFTVKAVAGWSPGLVRPVRSADLGWTSSVPGQSTYQFGYNLGFTLPNPLLLGFREGISLSLGVGPDFPLVSLRNE